MRIEHPMGLMDVTVKFDRGQSGFAFHSAGVTRTARMIARGEVMIPSQIWDGA